MLENKFLLSILISSQYECYVKKSNNHPKREAKNIKWFHIKYYQNKVKNSYRQIFVSKVSS